MCGITGWIDWSEDLTKQKHVLEVMSETLAKRGPDDKGYWFSTCAALAHRRLIVIDPEGGAQPMSRRYCQHEYVIIYNGELYNTPELRQELETRGHIFQSHSDTEALLLSYIEWGTGCVDHLNGIYAFAVWNEAEQSLFMARDRMGVKPLFYTRKGNALIFGSELKALLTHPAIKAEVNSEGLAEIFVMGPARTPGHGVFRNIYELKPGYFLIYNQAGLYTHKYWSLQSLPHEDDFETTTSKVRSMVIDSIERQLVSDVPVCTLLSGGLDSSAITAVASAAFKQSSLGKLNTYSVDYVGNDQHFRPSHFQPNSDSHWVYKMSRQFNTNHHNIELETIELVNSLEQAMLARDLPGMADVDSSLLLFCQAIKKEATVALSGECADEVFGGYPWFHNQEAINATTFPWSRSLKDRMSIFSPELLELMKPEEYMSDRYQETLAKTPVLPGEEPLEARLREICYLNITWFMTTLLDRKDRMSMATGLEVRVPFCDHRLVEYVWNIPWAIKNHGNREKGLLRKALTGILPGDVLERRKSPYPKTHNPAYTAAVRSKLLQILDDANSPLLPLININAIRKLAQQEGDAFDRPWFGQLMTGPQLFAYLIQVNSWLKEYKISIC
jgi:asparagine synthase (glutamine-hydrolysing)